MTVDLYVAKTSGDRLDVFAAEKSGLTRSYIKQLVQAGNVTLNGSVVKSGAIIKAGDRVEVTVPDPVTEIVPQDIPLDILYEDDDIAVINKQQGLTVHPGGGAEDNTLVNALMFRLKSLSSINGVVRPGIVHRLDKDTSGVMVIAKNDEAHLSLASQFENRTAEKIYTALLEGVIKENGGEIKTFIDRNPKDRKLMCVAPTGREAISDYEIVERFSENCLALFKIKTGRTHQIRVHAKYIGHPVVGDKQYGFKKQKFNLDGQLLHAGSLTVTHPRTGERMTFTAPLPDYFLRVLDILRKKGV